MYEPEEEPSFLSRYTVPLGVVAGLIVMAVAAFFVLGLGGGDDGDGGSANNGGDGNPTPAASPTATGGNAQEQAIGAYVRTTLNMEYAGDCSTTVPGQGGPNQTPAAGATVRLMELLVSRSPVVSPARPLSAPAPQACSAVRFDAVRFHYPSRPATAASPA